jgi:hypothetical protein
MTLELSNLVAAGHERADATLDSMAALMIRNCGESSVHLSTSSPVVARVGMHGSTKAAGRTAPRGDDLQSMSRFDNGPTGATARADSTHSGADCYAFSMSSRLPPRTAPKPRASRAIEIGSIPKKPPAPSVRQRRSVQHSADTAIKRSRKVR